MKISIIIPNYNGIELLRKNLPMVFEASQCYMQKSHNEVEVVVIDDCSTDNSIEYLKAQNSKLKTTSKKSKISLRLLQNEKNIGFSSSVNIGVKEAIGEIVILLNTDVCPEKDFLEPLISHFSNQSVFAVGCMDKSIEGKEIILRGRGVGKWEKGFLVHKRGEVNNTTTLWVNGGSGAFRKSIWEKLGGFNTIYRPFYWEDIDISYRALKMGFSLVFEPKSIVVHEHEKGSIKRKYSPLQIKIIAYRNQILFVWENVTDYSLWLAHIFWLPCYLIKAVFSLDGVFILGFLWACLDLPWVIFQRLSRKQLLKRNDKEIIRLFGNEEG